MDNLTENIQLAIDNGALKRSIIVQLTLLYDFHGDSITLPKVLRYLNGHVDHNRLANDENTVKTHQLTLAPIRNEFAAHSDRHAIQNRQECVLPVSDIDSFIDDGIQIIKRYLKALDGGTRRFSRENEDFRDMLDACERGWKQQD